MRERQVLVATRAINGSMVLREQLDSPTRPAIWSIGPPVSAAKARCEARLIAERFADPFAESGARAASSGGSLTRVGTHSGRSPGTSLRRSPAHVFGQRVWGGPWRDARKPAG